MDRKILEGALEKVYRDEFAEFDIPQEHRFSLRHRIKMRRIFSLYRKNMRKLNTSGIKFRRQLIAALIIIILLTIVTGCAAIIISHFVIMEHDNNTQLKAGDFSGGKEIIEEIYYIYALPDGFECVNELKPEMSGGSEHWITYTNDNLVIAFFQSTKESYDAHYSAEESDLEHITINGYSALYIDYGSEIDSGTIIWDNGDYIFEVTGTFPKNKLIELAESVKY